MATIRFASTGVDKEVTVEVPPGERRTLLSIAQDNGVPIPFNCQTGDCSACLVHVETRASGARPMAPPTSQELSLLRTMCYLTEHDIAEAERRSISPDVRLACQYEVRDETIDVFFENELGSS